MTDDVTSDLRGDCYEASLVSAEKLQAIKNYIETAGLAAGSTPTPAAPGGLTAEEASAIYGRLGLSQQVFVVHGEATAPTGPHKGRTFIHAWVEVGNAAFEGSNGQSMWYPKAEYYRDHGIVEKARYSPIDARQLATKHNRLDAWHLL